MPCASALYRPFLDANHPGLRGQLNSGFMPGVRHRLSGWWLDEWMDDRWEGGRMDGRIGKRIGNGQMDGWWVGG